MTSSGSVDLKMDPSTRKITREINKVINKIHPIEQEATAICHEIFENFKRVRGCFFRLSKCTSEVHNIFENIVKKIDFEHFRKLGVIYSQLTTSFEAYEKTNDDFINNFKVNILGLFSFSNLEEEGIKEVNFSNKLL